MGYYILAKYQKGDMPDVMQTQTTGVAQSDSVINFYRMPMTLTSTFRTKAE